MAENSNQNRKTSGFTNIGRIIQANRPERLGSAVAQSVSNLAAQQKQNIQQESQEARTGIQRGALGSQEDVAKVSGVLSAPTSATQQDQEYFSRALKGAEAYQGPKTFDFSGRAITGAQTLENIGKGAGTSEGRFGLLQRFIQGPKQYTSGQQKLDALLLGKASGSLSGIRQQTRGSQAELEKQTSDIRQNIEQAKQQTAQFGQQVGQQLEQRTQQEQARSLGEFRRAKEENDRRLAQFEILKSNLQRARMGQMDPQDQSLFLGELVQSGAVSQADIDNARKLGIGTSEILRNVAVDFSDAQGLQQGSFLTPAERANLAALARLRGETSPFGQPTKYKASAITGRGGSELAEAGRAFEGEARDLRTQIDAYNAQQQRFQGELDALKREINENRAKSPSQWVSLPDIVAKYSPEVQRAFQQNRDYRFGIRDVNQEIENLRQNYLRRTIG